MPVTVNAYMRKMVQLGMFCFYHPNLPAVAVCNRCGRSICGSCYKPYADLALCPDCYNRRVPFGAPTPTPQAIPAAMPSAMHPAMSPAPGGVWYGPFPRPLFFRHFLFPVALLFIAAGLIVANGIALLSPVFFAIWSGFFPWIIPISSFGFILGIVLGLVILGGVVMYFLGFRALAAFLVIPSAIVSLFIGGGFVIGLILGILAAFMVVLTPRFPPRFP